MGHLILTQNTNKTNKITTFITFLNDSNRLTFLLILLFFFLSFLVLQQFHESVYLHSSKDGLHVYVVLIVSPLVEEDLLGVGGSAQQLQLAPRNFRNPHEPLNRCLLLLPVLWNRAERESMSTSRKSWSRQDVITQDQITSVGRSGSHQSGAFSLNTSVKLTAPEQPDDSGHIRVFFIVSLNEDVLSGSDDDGLRDSLHPDVQAAGIKK